MPPFAGLLQADQAADGLDRRDPEQDDIRQTIFSFDGYRFRISYEPIEHAGWLAIPDPYNLQAVLSYDYALNNEG